MTGVMRAVVLSGPGPVENPAVVEPVGTPALPGWVRVAVRAFGATVLATTRRADRLEHDRQVGELVGLV